MASLADIFAEVKLDLTKQEESKLKRRIGSIDTRRAGHQVATRFGVGFNGAFGGIAAKSAGLFVAGFAAVKGLQVFGGFINDARESAKVSRITENAIRATGGAAKITAGQVGALATAISNKTGIDDEQVQTAANMLLTFKAVRNETGKGNDVFNRATQAAADLSVQFGGIDGASKQLGKALNDPIKGTAALSKAGVTFTAQQKDQIKTLVESGNTLAAQKIILKEVEGQVGGAAAAAADPLERLKVVGGNLAETIGGFLLPSVNKFANFATNTLVPGVEALFTAFQEGDVTSDGFVGFMERIGVSARSAFGFFKAEVLPRLKEFAGFVTGTVIPALGGMASFVKRNKDFFVPLAGTIVGIVAALKTWAVVQGILNVVLAANPIGLVIVAIAALVGGLVYAYKHSDQFRKVADAAFKVVAASGKFMWDVVLKPLFALMAATFKFVWERAQFWAKIIVAAFNALKGPAVAVFRFLVGRMLDFIGNMLDAAAKAFGWVPKLGGPLKNAAAEFGKFKTSVNKALDGINDEPVDIKVGLAYTQALGQATKRMKFAGGGGVFGGTRGKDSVPALLMPDEHVWTTREVAAVGGHGAMKRMRQAALAGELYGYANGGVVLNPKIPSKRRIQLLANAAAGAVDHTGTVMAKNIALAMVGGVGGPPGARKSFRGVTLNQRTIGMLLNAERLLGAAFHITQGSYSSRVAASGSTHAGGGAMDTNGPRGWSTAVSALRKAGFAAWHRTPSQGPWNHHIHSIALGDSSASPAAKAQMAAYRRGGDGLGHGMAKGGRVTKSMAAAMGLDTFDTGGLWRSGTIAANTSGKTETVVPGGGAVELGPETIRALVKGWAEALAVGKFRVVGGQGGSYVLQMTNG